MICAAGREVAHVGREEDTGDVGLVGRESADGYEGGDVAVLLELPDEDGALRFGWRLAAEKMQL